MAAQTPRILIAHCGVDASPEFITTAVEGLDTFDQTIVTSTGTELRSTLADLGREDTENLHIVVMPMTSGRNLPLIADTAKTCQWFKRNHSNVRIALAAPPLGATTTLAFLRATLRRETSADDIAVICSAAIDPFADAELFRIARLAWTHSSGADVVVAFDDVYPSVSQTLAPYKATLDDESLRPTRRSTVIRADLQTAENQKPLITSTALATAISQSAKTALHLLQSHDDDGIEAALLADHEHGYAHSHGEEDGGHGHSHGHVHGHGHHHHGHVHGHSHGHGHNHHHHHHSADVHAEFDLGNIDADATE